MIQEYGWKRYYSIKFNEELDYMYQLLKKYYGLYFSVFLSGELLILI